MLRVSCLKIGLVSELSTLNIPLPVWVATPDVNVNTTSFTVKMERPIKLSKDWCCVPLCKSDGRKRGK
jgi:hypothetical protein